MSKAFEKYWQKNSGRLPAWTPTRYKFFGGAKTVAADQDRHALARGRDPFARLSQIRNQLLDPVPDSPERLKEFTKEIVALGRAIEPEVSGTRWQPEWLVKIGQCNDAVGNGSRACSCYRDALALGHHGDGWTYAAAELLFDAGDADPIGTALGK